MTSGIKRDKLNSETVTYSTARFWKDSSRQKAYLTLIAGADRSFLISSGLAGGSEEEFSNKAKGIDNYIRLRGVMKSHGFVTLQDTGGYLKNNADSSTIDELIDRVYSEDLLQLREQLNKSSHGLQFLSRLDYELYKKFADASKSTAYIPPFPKGIPITHLTAPDPSDPFPELAELGIGIMPSKVVVDKYGSPIYVSGTATVSFHDPGEDIDAAVEAVDTSVTDTPMKTVKNRTKKEDSAPAPDIFKADDWGSW